MQTLSSSSPVPKNRSTFFSSVGRFLHLAGVEPWGRTGSGIVELIASLLLIVPATASIVLTIGVSRGAG